MATNEVRVKNKPIFDSQSIPQNKEAILSNSLRNMTQSNKAIRIKEEPIDIEMQTSKSHIESMSKEVEIKTEQKFSEMQEFINKTSIAFLNEETTTSNSQSNKTNKKNKNKLVKSK